VVVVSPMPIIQIIV